MRIRNFKGWRFVISGGLFGMLLALGITLSGGQRVSANPLPVVYVSGSITSNQTWSGGSVYMLLGTIAVPSGVTLTITEGAIVKAASASTAISVAQGGSVDVAGNASNPVIFTSYRDDTAGGDSNGDGQSTAAVNDYGVGISAAGSADISHAVFRFGYASVEGLCNNSSNPGDITLTDSALKGQAYFLQCGPGVISMERNVLEVPAQSAYALSALYSDISGIDLDGSDKNTIHSAGGLTNVMNFFVSYVPASVTMNISGSSGGVLKAYDIDVQGTMNLLDGLVVKVEYSNVGFKVQNGATFNVDGGATNPVIFTSFVDDSIGGDSNNNGLSTGQPGGYAAAIAQYTGGTVSIADATFRYAYRAVALNSAATLQGVRIENSIIGIDINATGQFMLTAIDVSNVGTGLTVMGGAKVTFRGSFTDISNKAIVACKWTESCNVDASYTQWGSATGPFVSGSSLACGNVITIPWKYNGTTYNGEHVFISNCDNSITPQQAIDGSIDNFQQRMSNRQIDCSGGYQAACQAMSNAIACLGAAVNLAGSTSPIPLPEIDDQGDVGTWGSAVKGSAVGHIRDGAIELVLVSTAGEIFSRIGSVSGLVWSMASAYNQCAP